MTMTTAAAKGKQKLVPMLVEVSAKEARRQEVAMWYNIGKHQTMFKARLNERPDPNSRALCEAFKKGKALKPLTNAK